jgi:hypothetical protein
MFSETYSATDGTFFIWFFGLLFLVAFFESFAEKMTKIFFKKQMTMIHDGLLLLLIAGYSLLGLFIAYGIASGLMETRTMIQDRDVMAAADLCRDKTVTLSDLARANCGTVIERAEARTRQLQSLAQARKQNENSRLVLHVSEN